MKKVKILRLKSSEDLISFVEINDGTVTLTYPLNVYVTYNIKDKSQDLVMNFWLPFNLIESQSVEVPLQEVLFIVDVKPEFEEYYLNFIEDVSKDIEDTKNSSEVKLMLEQFDAKAMNKIH